MSVKVRVLESKSPTSSFLGGFLGPNVAGGSRVLTPIRGLMFLDGKAGTPGMLPYPKVLGVRVAAPVGVSTANRLFSMASAGSKLKVL